jgi:hypothetical protein
MYEYGNLEQDRAVCYLGIYNLNLLCSAHVRTGQSERRAQSPYLTCSCSCFDTCSDLCVIQTSLNVSFFLSLQNLTFAHIFLNYY